MQEALKRKAALEEIAKMRRGFGSHEKHLADQFVWTYGPERALDLMRLVVDFNRTTEAANYS